MCTKRGRGENRWAILNLMYADDATLFVGSEIDMLRLVLNFAAAWKCKGVRVNMGKTKEMMIVQRD